MPDSHFSPTVAPNSQRIRELCADRGWSIETLAKSAECSIVTMRAIQNGKRVYLETVRRLAAALGTETQTLIVQFDSDE
jgi:transcriptional regulator with XRE-family HTH domain